MQFGCPSIGSWQPVFIGGLRRSSYLAFRWLRLFSGTSWVGLGKRLTKSRSSRHWTSKRSSFSPISSIGSWLPLKWNFFHEIEVSCFSGYVITSESWRKTLPVSFLTWLQTSLSFSIPRPSTFLSNLTCWVPWRNSSTCATSTPWTCSWEFCRQEGRKSLRTWH